MLVAAALVPRSDATVVVAAAAQKIGLDTLVPKFRDPKGIYFVVAGGEAGKFGAYLCGWVSGQNGSPLCSSGLTTFTRARRPGEVGLTFTRGMLTPSPQS